MVAEVTSGPCFALHRCYAMHGSFGGGGGGGGGADGVGAASNTIGFGGKAQCGQPGGNPYKSMAEMSVWVFFCPPRSKSASPCGGIPRSHG